jgi:peptidoglycan/LPS O-acetylase OafA/YrhL
VTLAWVVLGLRGAPAAVLASAAAGALAIALALGSYRWFEVPMTRTLIPGLIRRPQATAATAPHFGTRSPKAAAPKG